LQGRSARGGQPLQRWAPRRRGAAPGRGRFPHFPAPGAVRARGPPGEPRRDRRRGPRPRACRLGPL